MKTLIAFTIAALPAFLNSCTTVEPAPAPAPQVQSTMTTETTRHTASPYVAPMSSSTTETTTIR